MVACPKHLTPPTHRLCQTCCGCDAMWCSCLEKHLDWLISRSFILSKKNEKTVLKSFPDSRIHREMREIQRGEMGGECGSVKINLKKDKPGRVQLMSPTCHLHLFPLTKCGGAALKPWRAHCLTGAAYVEPRAEIRAVIPGRSLTADSRQARILGKPGRWYHQPPRQEGSEGRFQEDLRLQAGQIKPSHAFQPGSCM